jgi:hypothetical protein
VLRRTSSARSRRTLARVTGVTGIMNGTTNYILTKMEREQQDFEDALADAQRLGLASLTRPATWTASTRRGSSPSWSSFRTCSVRTADIEPGASAESGDRPPPRPTSAGIKLVVAAGWPAGEVEAFVARLHPGGRQAVAASAASRRDLASSRPSARPVLQRARRRTRRDRRDDLDDVAGASRRRWHARRSARPNPQTARPRPRGSCA